MDTQRAEEMIKLARELARRHNELVDQLERELTQPPHKAGEPCNLPLLYENDRKYMNGEVRFVYAGEIGDSLKRWYVSKDGETIVYGDVSYGQRELLHAIPVATEHRKGDVCDAERDGVTPKNGVMLYNELKCTIKGEYYFEDAIGKISQWLLDDPSIRKHITYTHVVPKYKEGQWVIIPAEKPRCIRSYKYEGGEFHYRLYENGSSLVGCSELVILRLAVPSDWAVEFNGVKVWMQMHDNIMHEYHEPGGEWTIAQWQVDRNAAAGILTVPQEVCDGQKQ